MFVAEKVHFQYKIPASKRNACSNEKSGVGYLVGVVNRNTEYLIATGEGIVACYTVRRMQDSEAYDSACKGVINVKYTDFVSGGPRTMPIAVHVPVDIAVNPDPNPIPTTYILRSTSLRPKDFTRHGFTGGCRGCEFLATGLGKRQNHTTECRLRMEALLAADEDGKRRLEEAEERKNRWAYKQTEAKADPSPAEIEQQAVVIDAGDGSEGGMKKNSDQLEGLDEAPASVRTALLGKKTPEEMDRDNNGSTADDGITCRAQA